MVEKKSHFPDTMSRVFSVTTESCETIKVDRERESYGPTAQYVKIFHCNVLQNDMEIPVFRTYVASKISERVT